MPDAPLFYSEITDFFPVELKQILLILDPFLVNENEVNRRRISTYCYGNYEIS